MDQNQTRQGQGIGLRERQAVRALFVILALGLIAQGIAFEKFGDEPFPGLFMPAFRGTGGHSPEGVVYRWVEARLITADGQAIPVSVNQLLAPIPYPAHRLAMTQTFLSPIPEGRTSAESGQPTGLRYRCMPGLRFGERNRMSDENWKSLRSWLATRAEEQAPGVEISRIEFEWRMETIRVVDGRIERDFEPIDTLTFELADSERVS